MPFKTAFVIDVEGYGEVRYGLDTTKLTDVFCHRFVPHWFESAFFDGCLAETVARALLARLLTRAIKPTGLISLLSNCNFYPGAR